MPATRAPGRRPSLTPSPTRSMTGPAAGVRDGQYDAQPVRGRKHGYLCGYTFSSREGEYTVRRNPEYMRAGKRKNADGTVRLVKETAKVSLLLPDGKEFQGKKRETDQKIEEILGLDAGQFTQIAMIAQGEFLQLLHAGSRERRKSSARSSRPGSTGRCRRN